MSKAPLYLSMLAVAIMFALTPACSPEKTPSQDSGKEKPSGQNNSGGQNNNGGQGDPEVIHVTGVSVSPDSYDLVVGNSRVVVATVLPSNATNTDVSWSSSAPDVVSVNAEGNITAIAPGQAIILATTIDGGFTAECRVSVSSGQQSQSDGSFDDGTEGFNDNQEEW